MDWIPPAETFKTGLPRHDLQTDNVFRTAINGTLSLAKLLYHHILKEANHNLTNHCTLFSFVKYYYPKGCARKYDLDFHLEYFPYAASFLF